MLLQFSIVILPSQIYHILILSYQTIFDLYLDTDYTFGQEEPERFKQYFGNLGSPIPEQGTSYSFVPDSHQTPIRNLNTTFDNPDPSLISYEDETSNLLLPTTTGYS